MKRAFKSARQEPNWYKWLEWSDGGDPGQFLTDDNVIQQVTNPKVSTENESDNDSDSEDSSNDVPTNGEAMEMLDKCLKWYECQLDATPGSIMLLKRIRDLAANKCYANLKQLTLHSYLENDCV